MELLKTLTELLKASFWPAIALLIFFDFHNDIKRTVHLLPCSIANANKLEMGPLKIEIKEQAQQKGNSELADTLGKLSSEAIVMLLRIPPSAYGFAGLNPSSENLREITVPDEQKLQILLQLEQKGFVQFSPRPLGDFINLLHGLKLSGHPSPGQEFLRTEEIDVAGLDAKTKEQLTNYDFQLSDKGKQAFDAIVSAIINQLNGSGGSAACG